MTRALDLADIQGNILRAYGRQGFPKARYIFLHIADAQHGRDFVDHIRPSITTAVKWDESRAHYPKTGHVEVPRPTVTINIAFTFFGLYALGLPTRTLSELPDEFIQGMGARTAILGDRGPDPTNPWAWDPIWEGATGDRRVHALIQLNAAMNPDGTPVADLERATQWLRDQCAAVGGGVLMLAGNGRDGTLDYQDASAIMEPGPAGGPVPTSKEPFGFTDGFGDPVFEGQYDALLEPIRAIGGGAITPERTWRPLATGEFLLGYPDEAQELSSAGTPFDLTRNGTFMAYRKLSQDVDGFQQAMTRYAETYARVMQIPEGEANETVRAKIAGRWADGIPLMAAPTYAEYQAFKAKAQAEKASEKTKTALSLEAGHRKQQDDPLAAQLVDFMYGGDPEGLRCPLGAHMRRANPRDMLDPTYKPGDPSSSSGSVLNNRRRILRRGLPYAEEGEQGIIFLALCASLFRQFEFVQQQWMNYGLDFGAGSDTCPLIGNHGDDAKFVIAADPATGKPPFFADRLPQFVAMRGGEYFFIPSMTALRMIGMGVVDPT